MESFREIDWHNVSPDEIKTLYKAVLHARQDHNLSWHDLFKVAFGGLYIGKGYEDNFRKGKIAAARAGQVFNWLLTNSPAIADQFEDEFFTARSAQIGGDASSINWSELLQSCSLYGRVEVFSYTKAIPSIIAFSNENQVEDATLHLGERFYFRVDCAHSGHLAALQNYRGNWYSFPLSPEQAAIPAKIGTMSAPISIVDQKIEPISEETDTGKHGFLFINMDKDVDIDAFDQHMPVGRIHKNQLDAFSVFLNELPETSISMYRCNLMIRS